MYVILFQEGNFALCLQSLAQIVPWMFALYQTRRLYVRIRDKMSLLVNHQNIRAGKIVVHKTSSKFSAMTIDQCNEQDNGPVKISMPKNHGSP